MIIVITCDCGENDRFDSRDYVSRDGALVDAVDEWKREHVRSHEKDGDHEDHTFTSEVER